MLVIWIFKENQNQSFIIKICFIDLSFWKIIALLSNFIPKQAPVTLEISKYSFNMYFSGFEKFFRVTFLDFTSKDRYYLFKYILYLSILFWQSSDDRYTGHFPQNTVLHPRNRSFSHMTHSLIDSFKKMTQDKNLCQENLLSFLIGGIFNVELHSCVGCTMNRVIRALITLV